MPNEQTPGATDNRSGAGAAATQADAATKAAADKATADAAATKAATDAAAKEAADKAAAAAQTPEAKAAAEKAAKDAADKLAAAGAPEKYADFNAPEGATLDAEVVTAFQGVAKKLNLLQDKAQLVIDKLTPVMRARAAAATAQVKADLLSAAKADKEFGGEKLEASVATAKLAIDAYFAPSFKKFLDDTGLGNQPEIIRGLLKIAQPLKQDGHVEGSTKLGDTHDARKFYPNSQMNA